LVAASAFLRRISWPLQKNDRRSPFTRSIQFRQHYNLFLSGWSLTYKARKRAWLTIPTM